MSLRTYRPGEAPDPGIALMLRRRGVAVRIGEPPPPAEFEYAPLHDSTDAPLHDSTDAPLLVRIAA